MRQFFLLVAMVHVGTHAFAQDSRIPKFHGFVTEGFLYSNDNNYLGMNTSSGSPAWTEAAVNVNDQLSDKLRVGAQFHTVKLGHFGSWVPGIDWALADYKPNQWIGVRAGKVKMRWGLYNDTQDADPGYVWSLLPEPIYGIDYRATDLSQLGAELYGRVQLPRRLGGLTYSAYYGYYSYSSNDGTLQAFREEGLNFTGRPKGKTPGFDLRWRTPVKGLTLGGSLMVYDSKGTLTDGTFRQPSTYWPTYYAQYDRRKFFLSAQYMRLVQYDVVTTGTEPPSSSPSDTRAWFAMAGFHLTDKLQTGIYYARYTVAGADQSDPANYQREWVLSGRYDIDSYFYFKLEGHFMEGNGQGFYGFDNPNDLKPRTKLLVAKVGFVF